MNNYAEMIVATAQKFDVSFEEAIAMLNINNECDDEVVTAVPVYVAHQKSKEKASRKRKNDFRADKRIKDIASFSIRSGKYVQENGAVHSRIGSTYNLRPTPKRWTNADALKAQAEYEQEISEQNDYDFMDEVYDAIAEDGCYRAYGDIEVDRFVSESPDYWTDIIHDEFIVIPEPMVQKVNHVEDYSKPFITTFTMEMDDCHQYDRFNRSYLMATLMSPSEQEIEEMVAEVKAKALTMANCDTYRIGIVVASVPVGGIATPVGVSSCYFYE